MDRRPLLPGNAPPSDNPLHLQNIGRNLGQCWFVLLALLGALAIVASSLAVWGGYSAPPAPAARPMMGLFTSLPIWWGESESIAETLAEPPQPHWVRSLLEQRYRVTPLDTLGPDALPPLLLIAQPRPLAPQENVALDTWVRQGGRVLLFADPMLTWHSRFAIGDKRRPQDVVLLSPILYRWGLELRIDEAQPGGEREMAGLPVNLPGWLVLTGQGHKAHCDLSPQGLVARCRIGKGRATIVADAALLEPEAASDGQDALEGLLEQAFGD